MIIFIMLEIHYYCYYTFTKNILITYLPTECDDSGKYVILILHHRVYVYNKDFISKILTTEIAMN